MSLGAPGGRKWFSSIELAHRHSVSSNVIIVDGRGRAQRSWVLLLGALATTWLGADRQVWRTSCEQHIQYAGHWRPACLQALWDLRAGSERCRRRCFTASHGHWILVWRWSVLAYLSFLCAVRPPPLCLSVCLSVGVCACR